MALLRLQTSISHLPNLLKPPGNPRRNQLSPPNAAKIGTSSTVPSPAAILARNVAAAWRGELLLLLPAAAAASWSPLPALAAEADGGGKVSLESIVVAIDDFNNRNPFFVAGVVFVWLVVIPLAQEYFRKYKAVGALDAFLKLRDVPETQLLDIRRGKSVQFMPPPNLRIVEKKAVQVEFDEENEKGFLREVLARFPDPANTVVCILDKLVCPIDGPFSPSLAHEERHDGRRHDSCLRLFLFASIESVRLFVFGSSRLRLLFRRIESLRRPRPDCSRLHPRLLPRLLRRPCPGSVLQCLNNCPVLNDFASRNA